MIKNNTLGNGIVDSLYFLLFVYLYFLQWVYVISKIKAGDLDLIPGLGRSPREVKGYLLQCTGHGVAKSQTRQSDFHFHFHGGDALLHNAFGLIISLYSDCRNTDYFYSE